MSKHKNVRENLLSLLKAFPNLVENYNALLVHYWLVFDRATNMEAIQRATPAETITRNLRALVSQGLINLPLRVIESRKEKEVEFRTEFSNVI